MICHDCGYEINENLKYCSVCHAMQKHVPHLYGMMEPDQHVIRRTQSGLSAKNGKKDSINIKTRTSKFQNHKLLPVIIYAVLPLIVVIHILFVVGILTNHIEEKLYGVGYSKYILSLSEMQKLHIILVSMLIIISLLMVYSILEFKRQNKRAIIILDSSILLDFLTSLSYLIATSRVLKINMLTFHYWKSHWWLILFVLEYLLFDFYFKKHKTYFENK